MKFISLFGLLVFLGIAFLMSNNKNQIKLRIIYWGLALQLLFASIILGKPIEIWDMTIYVSFSGMYIFVSLILMYIFKDEINQESDRNAQLKHAGMIFLGSAIYAF